MKNKITLLLALLLMLPALSACGRRYTKSEKVEHKVSAAGKERISVENISGNIKIVAGSDSSSITVKASKELKVRKRDLNTPFNEIEIQIDSLTDEVKIVTSITDHNEGLFKRDRNPSVDYEIHIPAGMDVKVNNVHGIISTSGVTGDIEISNVSGDVDLDNVKGKVLIDVTNGDITGSIDSTGGIEINNINGDVRLTLPQDLQAKIKADVRNGKISYEQLNLQNTFEEDTFGEKKSLRASIGSGGIEITIDVVNGRIRLYGKKQEII